MWLDDVPLWGRSQPRDEISVNGSCGWTRKKGADTMINIFDLYNNLKEEGVIFCFCGPTSQAVVEGIGETLRQRMELEGVGPSVISRVFSVFIEQIHNILHYSGEKIPDDQTVEGELRFGIVLVGMWKDRYYVRCGNFVPNRHVVTLSELLEQLQGMDKEQLKALYKDRRRSSEACDNSKGAGLGFIEMARKASEPLKFDFIAVDDDTSFFSITAII